MMHRRSADRRRRRQSTGSRANPYVLVSAARDGRLRVERFKSAADYRDCLAAPGATKQPVALDELIDLLESC